MPVGQVDDRTPIKFLKKGVRRPWSTLQKPATPPGPIRSEDVWPGKPSLPRQEFLASAVRYRDK